ncbi:MAG TPA: DUF711 family protein [Gemmatimonadota bacterium]|jgi:hypothetical protein
MAGHLSRRRFLAALGAGLLAPGAARAALANPARGGRPPFRVRTITAGVRLANPADRPAFRSALDVLARARSAFAERGYEIQTVRIATPPLAEYLPDWRGAAGLAALRELDGRAVEAGVSLSIGPVLTGDDAPPGFAEWAADLVSQTKDVSFSAFVASPALGVHERTVRAAAEAIAAIARTAPGGEGNFRFAATAFCPPGTPFFPAAWHGGEPAFSIGLESPPLLQEAFEGSRDLADARRALRTRMNEALRPVQALAEDVAAATRWRYLGIDVSPAPGLDASIGAAIETLTGVPFGEPSTLAGCAAITSVLADLDVRTCGYSGLMLPVLEDPVLARRADEGRYGIPELLLYSNVCGTGLDVVPLAGDVPAEALAATVRDVAALAARARKPLSARLIPVPGRAVGERATFDNPYLTDAAVMRTD